MLEPRGWVCSPALYFSAVAGPVTKRPFAADRLCCRLLLLLATVILAGCSEPGPGVNLVPVTGTVVYNQEPVEGATVVFLPQDHKYAAAARSDANGQFRLRTVQAKPDDGAVPGAFKVTVRKNYVTPENREIWELPEPYGLVDTTELTANVVNDQPNDFRFELKDRLTPAPPGSFSIVVIPDTQSYRGAGTKSQPESTDPVTNPIFAAHTHWISENLDRQNIVFVSHVGDIVDKDVPSQWTVARDCMDMIHGRVPYGISVGNHDMTAEGDSSLFQEYFPKSRFEDFDWYGGAYQGSPLGPHISGNNANSFQLFSAGGMDFVFLHLECNAPDDVLEWANQVLDEHSDRRALITSHMGWGPAEKPKTNDEYITGPKGRMTWLKIHGERGNTPQQLWYKCYRKHENLLAVFSGDQSRSRAIHAATSGDQGNVVYELLQDYGKHGMLRLYRFVPAEDCIDVFTFHPQTEELCEGIELVPDRNEHQFKLDYRMPSPVATHRR